MGWILRPGWLKCGCRLFLGLFGGVPSTAWVKSLALEDRNLQCMTEKQGPEDGGSGCLWNVGKLQDYMTQHSRKQPTTRTTWIGKMAFVLAGHGNRSPTLSEDAGSIGYSIASPPSAPRPRLSFRRSLAPFPSCRSLACLPLLSAHPLCEPTASNHPPTHQLISLLPPPGGPHKGQLLDSLSLMLHSLFSLLWRPTPFLLASWPAFDTDLSQRLGRVLLCRTWSRTDFPCAASLWSSGFGIGGSLSTSPRARLCSLPRPRDAFDSPGQCSFSECQYSGSKQLLILGWPLIRG
jgi:hypothetical protein